MDNGIKVEPERVLIGELFVGDDREEEDVEFQLMIGGALSSPEEGNVAN